MKLKKCYINNFGKLSDYSLEFNDGITVINEDNGFGKTTLCAFIKAMFYGFNQTRSKDLEENERLKYYPWQGGAFGGSIEFSCEKGSFRIERTFGKKMSDDTFALFDLNTGSISSQFSQNIGEELFEIDIKGFERCVNISSDLSNEKIPMSVSSKLSAMVDNTDDLNNYETAMATMLKRARQYSTTGNRGIVFDIKREISNIQNKIDEAKNAENEIEALQSRKNELEIKKSNISKELENTRALISENSSFEVIKEKIKHYSSLVSTAKSSEEKIENLKNKYDGQIPSRNDLEELENTLDNIAELSESDDVEVLRKERIIHSTAHSVAWITAAVLLVFGWGGMLGVVGGLIIAIDIISSVVLSARRKTENKKREEKLESANILVEKILNKYGIVKAEKSYTEIISEIKSDLFEYDVETSKHTEYIKVAKEYFERENLKSVKQDIQSKNPDDLKQKEKELTRELDSVSSDILSVASRIEKLQQIAEKYNEAVYLKEVADNKLITAEENYNALIKGMQLLKTAKENLSDKYRQKVENAFIENLKFLTDGKIEDIILSNDFDVSVVADGFSREYASFSAGTKAIIEIALRLAVCDSLFENEKSFMIFDDPFAFLDDKIFVKIAEKTRDLSQKNQIIYITCTKSRIF